MKKGKETALAVMNMALATGLSAGAKLRNGRRISYTTLGAEFDPNMTEEQWVEFGRLLKLFRDAGNFYTADWMAFGHRRFGQQKVDEALSQLQFDMGDVTKAMTTGLLPAADRVDGLTTEHHYVVGIFMEKNSLTETEAAEWLKIAKREKLTAMELQKSIEAGAVVRVQKSEGHTNRDGFFTIHGINTLFSRWKKNVEKKAPIDDMPIEQKRQIYEEIKPIGEMFLRLQKEVQA